MPYTKRKNSNIISKTKTKKTSAIKSISKHKINYLFHNKQIINAAKKVETSPSELNMKRYSNAIIHYSKIKNLNSYSPSINAKLKTLKKVSKQDIFGCGIKTALGYTNASNNFMIKIGYNNKNNPICIDAETKQGQNILLSNLVSNDKINPNKLIMPAQRHTNCCDNTMFATFFVSDKGRKFMRFFRQLMIEGKNINGKPIIPKSLRNSLLLFNVAIEACYSGNENDEILALNTNNIIINIYKSISKNNDDYNGIKNIDQYGNPYNFYRDLTSFLNINNDNSPNMLSLNLKDSVDDFFNNNVEYKNMPDIYVIQLTDNMIEERAKVFEYYKKPEIIKKGTMKYKLDSIIIRDITKNHFSACITCNNKEYVYDGATFSGLISQKWKSKINKDNNWKINNSVTSWNFMTCYCLLFYYRIN